MSWLWGNETTEQAQIVVSALQGELDERELKIQALEAALRREQHDFQQLLQGEIRELEAKRERIACELRDVDALIADKQALLQKGKGDSTKKKTKKAGATAAAAAGTAPAAAPAAAAAALEKKPSEKKKKAKKPPATAAAAAAAAAPKKALPMDEHLLKVAKLEPNVAFIIQRSTNANTVVYAGQVKGAALDALKPLEVYWLMFEKAGAPREDLNLIERNTAYGASCAPLAGTAAAAAGQFSVSLASLKDRECVLLLDADTGRVQARTTVAGRPGVVLRRVFVQMTTGWVPSVDYIELFGVDPATHELVYEKKSNK
ncbi:hypothetical protein PybrP1_008487 [[Pythium] brassicae (nom. inval.)]|nr:hypothetical protein PybrP1_008487 [[Pythium] brassicae (nom. inval.)]